jgi:hypothetical protein
MKKLGSILPLVMQAIDIRKAIADKILALPDNPDIQRHGERCFTMSASNLKKSWSYEYHDFKLQYQMIATVMAEIPIENTIEWFREIIKTNTLKYKQTTVKLNPEVIKYIKGIL